MTKIKRYYTLRKIALYKFLGKFIPYFKNKIMGFIKKEDISVNICVELQQIFKRKNINVKLKEVVDVSFLEQTTCKKDIEGNEGLYYIEKCSYNYSIENWDLFFKLEYLDGNLNFTFKEFKTSLLEDEKFKIFNDIDFKNEIIKYIKSIRTIP